MPCLNAPYKTRITWQHIARDPARSAAHPTTLGLTLLPAVQSKLTERNSWLGPLTVGRSISNIIIVPPEKVTSPDTEVPAARISHQQKEKGERPISRAHEKGICNACADADLVSGGRKRHDPAVNKPLLLLGILASQRGPAEPTCMHTLICTWETGSRLHNWAAMSRCPRYTIRSRRTTKKILAQSRLWQKKPPAGPSAGL